VVQALPARADGADVAAAIEHDECIALFENARAFGDMRRRRCYRIIALLVFSAHALDAAQK
jgi:hypothetical protein